MLPIGSHVRSSDSRPIPGPELTGSSWICRGQRVVLLLLDLWLLLVVMVLLLVVLLVQIPAHSGPRADRI